MSEDFELPEYVVKRIGSVRATQPLAVHEIDNAWEALSCQLSTNAAPANVVSLGNRTRWFRAAVVAAGFALIAGWHLLAGRSKSEPLKYTTYTTQPGQRASVTLADGSRVVLGPATTLRVGRGKSANGSVVDINGEALFSVSHAVGKPFTVTSHGVTTRVLGTEFVVRAYDRVQIRIAVREGRVSVQSGALTPNTAAIVNAGEAASVASTTAPSVSTMPDLASDFAWADGELVLRDVPLGEAMERLSRWYGMDFRASSSALLDIRVEGTFPSSFTRSRIQSLANVIGAQIKQTGKVVTFSAKK